MAIDPLTGRRTQGYTLHGMASGSSVPPPASAAPAMGNYTPTWQEMAGVQSAYSPGHQGWMDPMYQSILSKVGGQDALNQWINKYSYNPQSFAGWNAANTGGLGYGGSLEDMGLGSAAGTPTPTNGPTYTGPAATTPEGGTGNPYMGTGAQNLPPYTFGSNDGYQFGQQQNYFDPGYAFRLNQGINQIQNSAAGRGNLLSGATLKGINDYAQGSASQEFNNAFNRFASDRAFNYGVDTGDRNFAYQTQLNDQNTNLGILNALLGFGMQGTQGQAVANNLLATLLSQNALAAGQVGASGQIGGSNAINNAISQLLQQYIQNQWLGAFTGGGG